MYSYARLQQERKPKSMLTKDSSRAFVLPYQKIRKYEKIYWGYLRATS
jgi:hypothetical protein